MPSGKSIAMAKLSLPARLTPCDTPVAKERKAAEGHALACAAGSQE